MECHGIIGNIKEETFSLNNADIDGFYLSYSLLVKYSQVENGIFL